MFCRHAFTRLSIPNTQIHLDTLQTEWKQHATEKGTIECDTYSAWSEAGGKMPAKPKKTHTIKRSGCNVDLSAKTVRWQLRGFTAPRTSASYHPWHWHLHDLHSRLYSERLPATPPERRLDSPVRSIHAHSFCIPMRNQRTFATFYPARLQLSWPLPPTAGTGVSVCIKGRVFIIGKPEEGEIFRQRHSVYYFCAVLISLQHCFVLLFFWLSRPSLPPSTQWFQLNNMLFFSCIYTAETLSFHLLAWSASHCRSECKFLYRGKHISAKSAIDAVGFYAGCCESI